MSYNSVVAEHTALGGGAALEVWAIPQKIL